MSLIDEYSLLLIKQYWEKPRAKAEIEAMLQGWQKNYELLQAFDTEFDLDYARGRQLDIIGRIAGIPRLVPDVIPKLHFGFSQNQNARGFADRFGASRPSAYFANRFGSNYSAQELDDAQFRRMIRVKIALNNASAYISSDERISIQKVISAAFRGLAYVVDNQDMSLTLYISPAVEEQELRLIRQLGLLPKPQGVRYKFVIQAAPGLTFGFADNPNSKGFSDKFNPAATGGIFARRLVNA